MAESARERRICRGNQSGERNMTFKVVNVIAKRSPGR
jgi:hypothetical protein